MKKIFLVLVLGLCATSLGAQVQGMTLPADKEEPQMDDAQKKKAEAEEREQARRASEVERQREYKFQLEELYKACTIKPVMSDEEIEACRRAYRFDRG
jgi:hypothetical protein